MNKLKIIWQKESVDFVVNQWETEFTYEFTQTYIEPPKIMLQWDSKAVDNVDVNLSRVILTFKDDAWYTGNFKVIWEVEDETKTQKVYRFIAGKQNHKNVNYDILWLKKERTFEKWELKKVEYYEDWNETDWYVNLIVKEDVVYNRDENGYIDTRDKTITRINEDETEDQDIKQTKKKYSPSESVKAGERKRANMLSDAKIATIGLIAQTTPCDITTAETMGMPFIVSVDTEMSLYEKWVKQPLLDSITNDTTHTRLDNDIGGITIRQYLLSELTD